MIFAGILAAGTGSRIKSAPMPKQFLPIKGIPVFIRVLKVFLSYEKIDRVFVAINRDWETFYKGLMGDYNIDQSRTELVYGGAGRFESLVNIVRAGEKYDTDENSVILTHDCARLFVDREIIEKNIENIKDNDVITTCVPVTDTLVYCEKDRIVSSVPDRSRLWDGVTPQTFYIKKFLRILENLSEEDYKNYNEAGRLFLDWGGKYSVIEGSKNLFKITNDIDLQYAEFLIDKGFIKIKEN